MAVGSEIGRLREVLIHEPGAEVELMTPATAQELLYNDIVPVESVRDEHRELQSVLALFAEVTEVSTVLEKIASNTTGIGKLAAALSRDDREMRDRLIRRWHGASPADIRDDCITGVARNAERLADLYVEKRYVTPPLPNLYFTRDSAFIAYDRAYRSVMAGRVRAAEAAIMTHVLSSMGVVVDERLDGLRRASGGTDAAEATSSPVSSSGVRLEGGDVLVLDENTLLIGVGERSSAAAVDHFLAAVAEGREKPITAVVVDLPHQRSTIHLDMVVTAIGRGEFLGYAPFLKGPRGRTVYTIVIPPGYGSSWTIREHQDFVSALDTVHYPCSLVPCGGDIDVVREREQWFSGCNSFAVSPRVILVYRSNSRTLEALDHHGYAVHTGKDVLREPQRVISGDGEPVERATAIAVDGVELARGGGGPRCMTLPVRRDPLP